MMHYNGDDAFLSDVSEQNVFTMHYILNKASEINKLHIIIPQWGLADTTLITLKRASGYGYGNVHE
jgi:hypothetical protein